MKYKLKRKFDGYHFSPNMLDIYNPFSILNALSKKILADYWFRTGSPTYLVRLLSHFDENINEMVNRFILRVVSSITRQMWNHRCLWFIRAVISPLKTGIWIPIPISWISEWWSEERFPDAGSFQLSEAIEVNGCLDYSGSRCDVEGRLPSVGESDDFLLCQHSL